MSCTTETTRFMLDLPLMQTENGAGQKYCGAVENRHNPLHEAVTMTQRDAGWDGASLGLDIASMVADRAQANHGVAKVP